MGVKLSEPEAAAVDAARGSLSRSAYIRGVLLAAVSGGQSVPSRAESVPGDAVNRFTANEKPPSAAMAGLVPASSLPRPARCTHAGKRLVGGWCRDCDAMVEPGGLIRR